MKDEFAVSLVQGNFRVLLQPSSAAKVYIQQSQKEVTQPNGHVAHGCSYATAAYV